MSRIRNHNRLTPDQIPRRERGQENIRFPCSADHEQDWQPYPVDPYSATMSDDHTSILPHQQINGPIERAGEKGRTILFCNWSMCPWGFLNVCMHV